MRRDLFVFAGQSNMMGASVFPPKYPLCTKRSYEYKHKMRRLGMPTGEFVPVGYPVGEFSYKDMDLAYAPDLVNKRGDSRLSNYVENTYFCPSMSNLKSEADKEVFPFATFSEADAPMGATLAPFVANEWEKKGYACTYAHIAKGGVSIDYYFTDDMVQEYKDRIKAWNRTHGTSLNPDISNNLRMNGAADYFFEKCADFLSDAETAFAEDNLASRCFFWLQGEADTNLSANEYKIKLEILWETLKQTGFTYFFCLRVDFFGETSIDRIMQAQEQFVNDHEDAYMLTRAASYFLYAGRDEKDWFITQPGEEYRFCRDSFFGYPNQHINEKGFLLLAQRATQNIVRILIRGEAPMLEEENIKTLCQPKNGYHK
ncbi:MAG: hypothetical protein IKJ68_04285 [Clostridia bacterium]|nr:hypothetical protein [Clostridia bacterium]